MSPTSMPNLPSHSSKTQNLQRSLSTATLHHTSSQTKMPIRLFPANRVLSSTHRSLSTLLIELRTVDSDQSKSRNSLTHIRLRFDLLVDAFEDEKLRLSKKAFTRILYRRDIQNVEKYIVIVRRDMDKTSRDIEWLCKQMELNAARRSGRVDSVEQEVFVRIRAPSQILHLTY